MTTQTQSMPLPDVSTPQHEITIRSATLADLHSIAMMTWEILVVTNRSKLYRFEDSLAGVRLAFEDNSNGQYIIAVNGQRIVGQLKLTRQYNDLLMGDEAWIEHVFIHTNYRRQKIYDRLHAHTVELAQQWNAKRLSLHVVGSNERAKRAYEKQGMSPTGFWMTQSLND